MKQWGKLAILVVVLLLTACAQNETVSNTEQETKNEDKSNQQEDKADENNQNNSQDNNKEETEQEDQGTEGTDDEQQGDTEDKNEEDDSKQEEVKEPKYKVTSNWSITPINDANEKVVLLTIDDAPDKYGVEMAKTLKELNAPAIFFVNGHFMNTEEEKEAVKKIHEMGFTIANHTMTHKALKVDGNPISQDVQKEEIVGLSDLIEEVIGERPKFFRAPHGLNTDYSMELAKQEKMEVMNWSYGYDWNQKYMTEDAIADIMVNTPYLGNGSNLLMHDREWTAKALDDIVKGLREKGYELVDPEEIKTP